MKSKSLVLNLAVAAVATVVVMTLLFLLPFHRNITGFFRFGSARPASPLLDDRQIIKLDRQDGYDGCMFLAIALDPLLRHEGTVAALDYPKYRYRRILFPAIGYLAGLGSPACIPYAMVAVNALCVVALVWFVHLGLGAPPRERDPGLLPPLALAIPGVWMVVSLTTSDLLGSVMFTGALCAWRYGRNALTALGLCLATLTRDTYFALIAAFALVALAQRNWRLLPHLAWAAALPVAWNLFAMHRAPQGDLLLGRMFGPPFGGLLHKIRILWTEPFSARNAFEAFSLFQIAATILLLLGACLIEWRRHGALLILAGPTVAMLALVTMKQWNYYVHYVRITMDLQILLLLTCGSPYFRGEKLALFGLLGLGSLVYIAKYATL
ncbi:MAG: hypothetical protein FJ224_10125 [Lentisphaerae bacterium]|nr:hypothetical protein [Lentisphaerota bacterium]